MTRAQVERIEADQRREVAALKLAAAAYGDPRDAAVARLAEIVHEPAERRAA